MTDSLFDTKDEPQIDESKDYLADLVGEGKKFKDAQALAKGKWFADAQIEIQNKRMDQMREDYLRLKADYDSAKKLEQFIDQLDKRPSEPTIPTTPVEQKDNAPKMTSDDIEKLVQKKIQETRSSEKAQENFNTVMGKLKERYGTNYQNVLLEQTDALGLTVDDVNALARKSPTAFFKTMGLDQMPTPTNQAPPRSTQQFAPKGAPRKTWTYYQEQFKKNPKLYYDPKVTNEMVQSMAELGDAFKDGDFSIYGD